MRGTITEAELRERIAAGGTILDALAVIRDRQDYPRVFLLYLRCSWSEGDYLAVALHRAKGLREHKRLDAWIALLDSYRYSGPITLVRDTDERTAGLVGLGRKPGD